MIRAAILAAVLALTACAAVPDDAEDSNPAFDQACAAGLVYCRWNPPAPR